MYIYINIYIYIYIHHPDENNSTQIKNTSSLRPHTLVV